MNSSLALQASEILQHLYHQKHFSICHAPEQSDFFSCTCLRFRLDLWMNEFQSSSITEDNKQQIKKKKRIRSSRQKIHWKGHACGAKNIIKVSDIKDEITCAHCRNSPAFRLLTQ